MINLVALSLVITSLVAAGVFSPPDDVIVKDGHRVVTVEYDEHGKHNTKVSISPPSMEERISSAASDVLDDTKARIKRAGSVFQNKKTEEFEFDPVEMVCDAYDVCRDKATGAIVRANEAKDSVVHKAHDWKEGVKETMKRTKDTAVNRAEDMKQGIKEAAEEKRATTKETVVGAVSKAAKETKDVGKTMSGDVISNVTEEAANIRDYFVEKTKQRNLIWDLDKVIGLMTVLNMLGFSLAYGMSFWVTFVSSYVLSRALPRHQLGVVHSKIYPVYFRVLGSSICLAFLGHTPQLSKSKFGLFQGVNLLGSLFLVLLNCFYLEPRATKVMFERMKVEKEEGRRREAETSREEVRTAAGGEKAAVTAAAEAEERPEQEDAKMKLSKLSERLERLNTYSSLLNIMTLMFLSWHLVHLAQCIRPRS